MHSSYNQVLPTGQKVYHIQAKKISFVETGKMQNTLSVVQELIIESMMGLRPRQANLRQFSDVSCLIRGIMKTKTGIRKRLKTCFKKGLLPHNKGIKEESRDFDTRNEFQYIRPTATEVAMAQEDPLRPHSNSNRESLDGRADSMMVLRQKPDTQLEEEKRILFWAKSMLNCIFTFHS